jgi:quinol-cytochrome oxidoreductase complex cytochrome b subunit
MFPEGPLHPHRRWALRSSWGELAYAGLLIALASGVALALPYDVDRPYDSVAWLLLANPAASYFRNIHYWAGQWFLVLTLAHAWDHLARSTETRVPRTRWWRVVVSLPLAAFVMFSGFLLKGDAESQQALLLSTALLERIPVVGHLLAVSLFGSEAHRQILYVHHVATASMLTWVFTAEHARALWPRLVPVVESLVPIAWLSVFLTPALHDGLDPVVKGPWYFLGLQEALHWSSRPLWIVAAAFVALVLMLRLPRWSERQARRGKWALVAVAATYAMLTVVGVWFRGENWSLVAPWSASAGIPRSSGLEVSGHGRWWGPPVGEVVAHDIPVVLGRREGCLFCHRGMKGLSASHSAEAVGCASCHDGNPFSLDKTTAHEGLVPIPGNLASVGRTCGTPRCHPSQVERVSRSLMTTMAGVVSVDRAVFGEPPADGLARRSRVSGVGGRTGADSHLRQLCASCHLGAVKTVLGPTREDSRGGGCIACHLQYSPAAVADLPRRNASTPSTHPNVSIAIQPAACFGCHSRSGRIATSYEGWNEISGKAEASPYVPPAGQGFSPAVTRRLADGRLFAWVAPDVHARSMDCVDCHTAREVMGDGQIHARQHEAVRVQCEDCHRRPLPASDSGFQASGRVTLPATYGLLPAISSDRLDSESLKIAELRGRNMPAEMFLATARGGDPLMNTGVDPQGVPWLVAKRSGERLPLKPAAAVCVRGAGHERLSCISCHAAWAPRCPQCHTAFDPRGKAVDLLDGRTTDGAWIETPGEFRAVPPTLGVRLLPAGQAAREAVDTFIPGMVMTLDRNQAAGARPDVVFRRLYARAFSHTIGRTARSCESCHADPVALGYGAGLLRYERDGDRGRWGFVPRFAPGPDGLPADAWIGFLRERTAATSTRNDVRPFTVEEQKRILTVGACLTCHAPSPDGTALRFCANRRKACAPISDFRTALARVSKKCLVPRW